MARKSRKPENLLLNLKPAPETVGYIRLSVVNKDDAGSVENQQLIIEDWCRQHQTLIFHYYIGNGISGQTFDRPAFKEMIQDILDGKIDCVVVKDLSRLGRNYIETGYYIEVFFPSHKVRFVSVND